MFQLSHLQDIQWHNSDNVEWSTLDEHTKFEQDTAAFTRDCLVRPAVLRHSTDVLRREQGSGLAGQLPSPTPRTLPCAWNTGNGLLDLSEWQEFLVIALGNVNHEFLGALRELPREESWKKNNSMAISHCVPPMHHALKQGVSRVKTVTFQCSKCLIPLLLGIKC